MRNKWFWKALLLGAVVLGFAAWQGHALQLRADDVPNVPTLAAFVSPLPTPPAVPTPVPTPSPHDVLALQYVAQRHGIPLKNLEIGQMHRRDYFALDRHYDAYTILERGASRQFRLMVNLSDDSIAEDIGAVERADAAARQKRYGKFDPPLYERLQTAGEQEVLSVTIWVGGVRGRNEEELQQLLASRYPEVREALARHAPLLDLADPALVRRVKQEYEQLKRDDIAARIRPLVAHLESQAVSVQSYSLLPSVAVTLTKSALLTLAQREDVGALYLVEGVAEPALDTAVPTDRVAPLWTVLGINGVAEPNIPQTIAIVEHGNVALDNTFLHRSGTRLLADNGDQDHTTAVASAAASFHGAYRGMAPGAIILSAGENGQQPNQQFALNWALDQGAVIANLSECWYNNMPDLDWLDRAFDYTARTRHATITTAAGNRRQEYVCSPAKGWNVITVGGINDHGTADWSDDTMFYVPGQTPDYGSSYRDPGSPHGDRQKPEVAAPAQDITAFALHNNPLTASGTSLAAPQVAGLAALLMQRNAQLSGQPTAVKAILMASAVHNVEGDSRLSDQDGAGSIDAALAGSIAQNRANDGVTCSGPCWWAIGTQSSYPSPGGSLNEYFRASRGERVRVAIAWWSLADPPPSYPTVANDVLASDFDLRVWGPSGAGVGSSVSWDNNYEIVDFVAPETGTYRIEAYKSSTTTESTNELGIAWVKDATYLPDLANEATDALHPWVSEIYIRNEAPIARGVLIYYHENEGFPTPKGTDLCNLAPNQWCAIPMDEAIGGLYRIRPGQRGSATVQGGEDVTVLVMNTHQAAPYTADSYTGIAQTSPALRAPLIYLNNSSWQTDFTIYNPHSQADNIQVIYDAWSGSGCTTGWLSLPANGNFNVNQLYWPHCSPLSSPFIGGARITSQSGRPLAGVAFQWNWVNSTQVSRMSYELFATGASPAYAPLVMRNNSGYYTGIGFQDTSGNAENLTLHYYQQDGSLCGTNPYYVGANGAYPVNPAPPNGICVPTGSLYIGGARATRGANLAFAGVVNQVRSGANTAMSYDMPSSGARTVIVPLVMRDRDNWRGKNDWITGFAIQNTAGSAAVVTIQYYAQGGQLAGASTFSVAAYGVAIVNPAPSNISPFLGSAVIVADQPVAVMVDYASTGTDDHGMSVAGVNR